MVRRIQTGTGSENNPNAVFGDLNGAITSDKYLTADGSTDDSADLTSLIEENEGETILLKEKSGAINLDSQVSPTTSGSRTRIVGIGNPTIDVGGISTGRRIDLRNADNITLENVTISGTSATGFYWSIQVGEGFRSSQVELDGGAGGWEITDPNVVIRDTVVRDQRKTDTGECACIHVSTGAEDVEIIRPECYDSDRGIEIEDGASDITVRDAYLENIDNSVADTPGSQVVWSVHNHTGNPASTGVLFDGGRIESCSKGVSMTSVEDSSITRGEIRDVTCVDIDDACYFSGDVTVDGLTIKQPTVASGDVPNLIWVRGGNVTLKDVETLDAPSNSVFSLSNNDITPKGFTIKDSRVECGSSTADYAVLVQTTAGINDTVRVTGLKNTGTANFVGVAAKSSSLSAPGWGLIVRDCEFVTGSNGVEVDSGNSPGYVAETYRSTGTDALTPSGSVSENNL